MTEYTVAPQSDPVARDSVVSPYGTRETLDPGLGPAVHRVPVQTPFAGTAVGAARPPFPSFPAFPAGAAGVAGPVEHRPVPGAAVARAGSGEQHPGGPTVTSPSTGENPVAETPTSDHEQSLAQHRPVAAEDSHPRPTNGFAVHLGEERVGYPEPTHVPAEQHGMRPVSPTPVQQPGYPQLGGYTGAEPTVRQPAPVNGTVTGQLPPGFPATHPVAQPPAQPVQPVAQPEPHQLAHETPATPVAEQPLPRQAAGPEPVGYPPLGRHPDPVHPGAVQPPHHLAAGPAPVQPAAAPMAPPHLHPQQSHDPYQQRTPHQAPQQQYPAYYPHHQPVGYPAAHYPPQAYPPAPVAPAPPAAPAMTVVPVPEQVSYAEQVAVARQVTVPRYDPAQMDLTRYDDRLRISVGNEVIAKIAGVTARQVRGVHRLGRLASPPAPSAGAEDYAHGVVVETKNDLATVKLDIVVQWGAVISKVTRAVGSQVIANIQELTGFQVDEVIIEVDDIHLIVPNEVAEESPVLAAEPVAAVPALERGVE